MRWHRIVLAVVATLPLSLPPGLGLAQNTAPRVYSDAGNIFIEHNGAKTKLTASEMDVDPVLAPNGAYVVYTRQGQIGRASCRERVWR